EHDQVIAIKASGQITRSDVSEVAVKGRDTMGVKFVGVKGDDSVVAIAINPEATEEEMSVAEEAAETGTEAGSGVGSDRAPGTAEENSGVVPDAADVPQADDAGIVDTDTDTAASVEDVDDSPAAEEDSSE
ncbi:MAG: hypothetical protein L0G99_02305, partial [Propionibacteriales bacterium]|nr:hypothetical protein [Propionibacteriales bacterium]